MMHKAAGSPKTQRRCDAWLIEVHKGTTAASTASVTILNWQHQSSHCVTPLPCACPPPTQAHVHMTVSACETAPCTRFIFCMQDPCSRWKTNGHANWQKQMMARVANAHTIRQQTQNKNCVLKNKSESQDSTTTVSASSRERQHSRCRHHTLCDTSQWWAVQVPLPQHTTPLHPASTAATKAPTQASLRKQRCHLLLPQAADPRHGCHAAAATVGCCCRGRCCHVACAHHTASPLC